jgi:hypothetical protein
MAGQPTTTSGTSPGPGPGPGPVRPGRASGWPVHRTPRWLIPAGVLLLGIAVAVGLAHRPSHQQRATDMHGFLYAVTFDIDSCAGDVQRAVTALQAIQSGSSHNVKTAVNLANNGAADCSPANDELIDDLESYEVPESLASYHLGNAVTGLINWAAPDAERVQTDIATVLAVRGTAGEAGAQAALHQALAKLDDQRAAVRSVLRPAISALTPGAVGPALPG